MWIVDSGATSHMCKDAALFNDLQPLDGSLDVTLGDGHVVRATGRGRVRLTLELNCGKSFCTLSEVMLVPGLAYNLLSVAKVSQKGGMDNGGEYTSHVFEEHLSSHGIRHETTVPKTPEQNGTAERFNRTLLESIRAMLGDSRLPKR